MHVVLARHGNTFELGERPVWVGARTDLPLVAKGQEQASRIGETLKAANLVPHRTLAGPLKRTLETARLALVAAGAADAEVEVDARLREIDYGTWEGKSSDEICSMGGEEELGAWERQSIWPTQAGWPSTRSEYVSDFLTVLEDVRVRSADPTLIVSSNGIFKLFALSVGESPTVRKMGTGNLSLLRLETGAVKILCWDLAPAAFLSWTDRYAP